MCRLTKYFMMAASVLCLTLSMSHQSFGALSEFNWTVDNPEGAAATMGVYPITGGPQDYLQDPVFVPSSPLGYWKFLSFNLTETLWDPPMPGYRGGLTVEINGVLSRVGGSVPGPGEIPFSFNFSTGTPGIFDGAVLFPITQVPEGVDSLTFASFMTYDIDAFHQGLVYGMGFGVGLIPEPATLALMACGALALLRRR